MPSALHSTALSTPMEEAPCTGVPAASALGRVEGTDLRGHSDGQLLLRRAAWEQEAAWAPPHVAEDLRLARLQARAAWENLIREQHESRVADPGTAARHDQIAAAWRDMHATATTITSALAQADQTRREWQLTEPTRQAALAAGQELRRRHPDQAKRPQAAQQAPEPAGPRAQEPAGQDRWDSVTRRIAG
ncbi:MAG: hypothetical protein ACRDNZ_14510, partial [Streptosporangiaceae bacterium]